MFPYCTNFYPCMHSSWLSLEYQLSRTETKWMDFFHDDCHYISTRRYAYEYCVSLTVRQSLLRWIVAGLVGTSSPILYKIRLRQHNPSQVS